MLKPHSFEPCQERRVKMGGRLLKHARYYLVAPGGEPSDAAIVWGHGAADRGAVATGGLMYQIGG